MSDLCRLIWCALIGLFRPRAALEAHLVYLPRTPQRLRRLAEIVGSRDIFVLLQGPSLATFAARLHEFAGFEFAIATLNSFPPIEQELRRINRYADILLFNQPGSICSWILNLWNFSPARHQT